MHDSGARAVQRAHECHARDMTDVGNCDTPTPSSTLCREEDARGLSAPCTTKLRSKLAGRPRGRRKHRSRRGDKGAGGVNTHHDRIMSSIMSTRSTKLFLSTDAVFLSCATVCFNLKVRGGMHPRTKIILYLWHFPYKTRKSEISTPKKMVRKTNVCVCRQSKGAASCGQ